MLRVLTLSTLFPNAAQPTLGVFVERQTLGLAARADVEVEVVAPVGLPPWPLSFHPHYRARSRLPREENWKGLKVHRPHYRVIPRFGDRFTAASMARALLPLLRQIRVRFPFDVIDAEFFWPDGPAAMLLARALDVPFSIKARGSDIQYWSERRGVGSQLIAAAKAANGLLAVSAALKRKMTALGMPGDRIKVHYTGIDMDRFVPLNRAEAKARLGVSGPLIVTAGALIERKGQRLALAALEHLDATLLLVGDGPDRGAIEQRIRERGLDTRVRLLGNRPHEELPGLLAAADVMVLPTASEGLANVWVEALACGTPVVTGDVGGAREVIDRPEAGTLTTYEAGPLAAAIGAIIAHPPDPAAVRRTVERFSWERNGDELFAHLDSLVR
jgi:teichuronic acid biosynthesis glycosyltransferase TuaC